MTFVIGMCAGIITSERVYLSLNAPEPLRGDTRVGAGEVDVGIPAKIERRGAAQVGYGQRAGRKVGEPRSPLEKYLIQIAPEGDVLVAISDMNLVRWGNMLGTWVECVQHVGISNYMVIAIDRELEQHLRERDVNVFLMERSVAAAQQGTGSNHAVSALKFGILQQLLALGWNVLLSDVDVVTLRNPFDFLHRDRDIEGMTDGFDDATAYGAIEGFDDPSMGWARYAQKHTMFALNSGLFFVMANERTVQLMGNLEARLRKAKYWDQTAFNEEVFFSPRDGESKPAITVRVMDIMKFTNSKVLFKRIRNMPPESRPTPVMVHINYHPDKHERMKAVIAAYVHGKPADLMRFPGGSEAGSR